MYFFEDCSLLDLSFEGFYNFVGLFVTKFLVFKEFVGDDETLIISFFDRLLDFVIVGFNGQIHGFDLLKYDLINLKLLFLLN